MKLSAELAAAAVVLVVVAVGFLVWRLAAGRSSTAKPVSFRGPASMHFTCAGCSGQFPHTKRTVAAWEKGSRRVFCDACHRKWRNARPPQARSAGGVVHRNGDVPLTVARPTPAYASRGSGRTGCLGVFVLLLLAPAIVLAAVANA